MLRERQPNYVELLKGFHPKDLQTKCYALARYRYRRPLLRFEKHQVIFDKLVLNIIDGKVVVYLKSNFGGYR